MLSPSSPKLSAGSNGYGAILFDLDGTLLDSLPALTSSINAILEEDGRYNLSEDEIRTMVGDGIKVLIARAYAATGAPPDNDSTLNALVARFSAHYNANPSAGCTLFPHVPEVLAGLVGMGYRIGVLTNKPITPTLSLLQEFTLMPILSVVVGGDSTPNLKPHPEPFLHAADQLEIAPERVIMVGDSINDTDGAHRAGMRAIAVTYGYTQIPASEFGADALIDSLIDLPHAALNLPMATTIAP
ncbi:MAG: phosphoglycolate phosphatase [Rhodospirillaceae bacterium]|nr:phosphoglycolate phosphatase [Rhodospirillaceae bacterium]